MHNLFVVSLVILQIAKTSADCDSTLQLVHILFRHGDRTTDVKTLYPKDPHINETYYPHGRGELNNKGKQRQFKLGKMLRQRYDNFLGEIYTPDVLEAWSSDVNRTKMSVQLVLAGLFPPKREQVWENDLPWQPIPFRALPTDQDTLFLGAFCPSFKKHLSELVNSSKMKRELENHADDFKYLSENSGSDIKTYWDTFYLYMCLTTEKEHGFVLPEWTKRVYPQPLKNFTIKSYGLSTANTEMRRYASGTLLKKIVNDSKGKVDNQHPFNKRKIFLYSGHELNITHLLQTMDVFESHIPPYGSFVLFELHNKNGTNGFKIYYYNSDLAEPRLLKLPACDEFCPLDDFISLMEEYFPEKLSC